jgi:hypothetical protein
VTATPAGSLSLEEIEGKQWGPPGPGDTRLAAGVLGPSRLRLLVSALHDGPDEIAAPSGSSRPRRPDERALTAQVHWNTIALIAHARHQNM